MLLKFKHELMIYQSDELHYSNKIKKQIQNKLKKKITYAIGLKNKNMEYLIKK